MTRIAALADIHGNLPALDAVTHDMAAFAPAHVVVLGDNINWGPSSAAVLEYIHARGWTTIRGNHEFYLLYEGTPHKPAAWARYNTPAWLNATIPKRWRDAIAAQPDDLRLCYPDAPYIRAAHAIPGDHWRGIYPTRTSDNDVIAMLAQVPESVVLVGHTHLPVERRVDRWHIVNPGSVGVPLDGDPRAAYAILDGDANGWRATFRRVPYDFARLTADAESTGHYDALGITGRLMIEEMRIGKPLVHPFNVWRAGRYPQDEPTIAMMTEFLALPGLGQEHRLPDYRDEALAARRHGGNGGAYPVII